LQVGNTHATRRAILFKKLNYILREIYDILSEDALNYPVQKFINPRKGVGVLYGYAI